MTAHRSAFRIGQAPAESSLFILDSVSSLDSFYPSQSVGLEIYLPTSMLDVSRIDGGCSEKTFAVRTEARSATVGTQSRRSISICTEYQSGLLHDRSVLSGNVGSLLIISPHAG